MGKTGNGNGVWKWVAGTIVAGMLVLFQLLRASDLKGIDEKIETVDTKVKEVQLQANGHDSDISRLNTIGAVNNQWQQMVEKKIDLLLRHAGIPEYQWPGIPVDTTR